MKTAYISSKGLRIVIETIPKIKEGIDIVHTIYINDSFSYADPNLEPVLATSDVTEEQYHLMVRDNIRARGGKVVDHHSTPIN